jgi:stearoyl-CoA desaturase (delta-9 desaturase)
MSESIHTNLRSLEREKLDYSVCIQFLFMHLACFLVIWTGVSTVAVVTCVALYFVRMFAITAGFHRLFAHRTYVTGRFFQFLMAFTATAAYQKGPLWWSSHHRRHHLHADTEDDLHSPLTRTLWRSHVGWFLSRESQMTDWKLVANLNKYADLRFLDRYYSLPPALLAIGTFILGAALQRYAPGLGTSGWQMLVWGFFLSTVLLYHGTFTVNSLAHIFGSRRFATDDNSRNNLFVALITLGEGWHNNHHHYQSSERQGFYWWELDISHYTLRALSWLGIVWDLRSPPPDVLAAQPGSAPAIPRDSRRKSFTPKKSIAPTVN